MLDKEKKLVTNIFSFSRNVSTLSWVWIILIWTTCTCKLSSADAFNLDQSNIL